MASEFDDADVTSEAMSQSTNMTGQDEEDFAPVTWGEVNIVFHDDDDNKNISLMVHLNDKTNKRG